MFITKSAISGLPSKPKGCEEDGLGCKALRLVFCDNVRCHAEFITSGDTAEIYQLQTGDEFPTFSDKKVSYQ